MTTSPATRALWEPSRERIERANLSRFIRVVREEHDPAVESYADLYDWSINRPEAFWTAVWDFCGIRATGDREPVLVDGDRMPGARWFPAIKLNFAQNLLRFRDDRDAIVCRSEYGAARTLTYAELHEHVAKLAAALRDAGVGIGDHVVALLPNVPDAIVAMLAATSLGAVWSSCSPDVDIARAIERFGPLKPKVLFAADAYAHAGQRHDCLELARDCVERIASIEHVVVIPVIDSMPELSTIPRARTLAELVGARDAEPIAYAMLPFDHPLFVTYSPRIAAVPTGIVHGAGGTLIQHLKEHVLHSDLKREDHVLHFAACDSMPWIWLASSLAAGVTIVMYDGASLHPDGNRLWDLVDEHQVSVLCIDSSAIAALESAGSRPRESHRLLQLKTILSTGAPLSSESFAYCYRDIKDRLMVSSIAADMDTLSCHALGAPLLPVHAGATQTRGLGMKVEVLDADGAAVREAPGELACTAPFPSMPIGFADDDDGSRYRDAYFSKVPGAWCAGVRATLAEHDGLVIHEGPDAPPRYTAGRSI